MPPPTRKHAEPPQALASHKLLVDTCFLMDQNFPNFLQDFTPVFQQNKILIPKRVVQELQQIVRLRATPLAVLLRALVQVGE